MNSSVLCFGEVLWDCWQTEKKIGGAPLNVALHLTKNGIETQIISRVGNDALGEILLNEIKKSGLDPMYIQKDSNLSTGTVVVDPNKIGANKFDIIFPCAWDNIQFTTEMKCMSKIYSTFVYGTLAARDQKSKKTLFGFLDQDFSHKVYDLNFRKNFYDKEVVRKLLNKATIVKLNDEEMSLVAKWLGFDYSLDNETVENNCLRFLSSKYSIDLICLTKGAKGAKVFHMGTFYIHEGEKVENVVDTTGAGDAFLAGFLRCFLKDRGVQESLDFAVSLGAFVVSKQGSNPHYVLNKFGDLENS